MTPVLGTDIATQLWQEVASKFKTVFREFSIDRFAPNELATVEFAQRQISFVFLLLASRNFNSFSAKFSFN